MSRHYSGASPQRHLPPSEQPMYRISRDGQEPIVDVDPA
jgi:hypothetical protein